MRLRRKMRINGQEQNDIIECSWEEALETMKSLFYNSPEAAIFEEREYASGVITISVMDRNESIIMQIQTP